MPTIGIILCETLELEFARLLANDNSVDCVSVISSDTSKKFVDALESNGAKQVLEIPHLNSFYYEPTKLIYILAEVLPMNLHRSRNLLKESIFDASRRIAQHVDSLFLGYGICGTGETNSEIFKKLGKPIFMLSEANNPVDDCIGLVLGSRKRYYAEQCNTPGTFYITAGWTSHWRGMLEYSKNKSEYDAIKKMFNRYKRILLIKSEAMSLKEMKNNIAELKKILNLDIEIQEGTLNLLEKSWNFAKKSTTSK